MDVFIINTSKNLNNLLIYTLPLLSINPCTCYSINYFLNLFPLLQPKDRISYLQKPYLCYYKTPLYIHLKIHLILFQPYAISKG